jgi:hypothetical protein
MADSQADGPLSACEPNEAFPGGGGPSAIGYGPRPLIPAPAFRPARNQVG